MAAKIRMTNHRARPGKQQIPQTWSWATKEMEIVFAQARVKDHGHQESLASTTRKL
jgi:hypothetical protein